LEARRRSGAADNPRHAGIRREGVARREILACSVWNRIPLFASLKARTYQSERQRDETHYFLIPFVPAPGGYAFYSVRYLPEGVGAINDLPKLRVFHLPVSGSEQVLEEFVVREVMHRRPGDELGGTRPYPSACGTSPTRLIARLTVSRVGCSCWVEC
jgi:hypothetical protein